MEFIKYLLAVRPSSVDNRYWGDLALLFVGIVPADRNTDVWAYGIDPRHIDPSVTDPFDPADAGVVFAQVLPTRDIDTFLARIKDGGAYTASSPTRLLFGAVDVSTSQPPTQGPKMLRVLARAAELLAIAKLTA